MEYKIGDVELRFAQLIWANQPIPSGELVGLAAEALTWKKPTTYTVLRKLCEKGLFENKDGLVTAKISQEDFMAVRSETFVEESFGGSLPRFLAAFSRGKKLSDAEIAEIKAIIDGQEG
ncbi:BlaI/MecI/CopY family transcriptional regulator [Bengtsoniella intestinalis]|uniref:BlaI/MecI/CopY family transcriptional regulator n=1 Tax=Bengtsoniella intestinalis TaxID=3073143 RepID=UPI00391F622E